MNNICYLLVIIILFSCGKSTNSEKKYYDPHNYDIVKQAHFEKMAVTSAHPLASLVGKEILSRGGNAIDAAIAVQYALAVVYPNAGNIGGGGFMVVHTSEGNSTTIDFREKAPSKAFRDMYLDEYGEPIDSKSRDGHLAAGVPGTVAGMQLAYEMFGTIPFEELIQPAIEIAEKGFVITLREARGLNRNKNDFLKYCTMPSAFVKETEWNEKDTLFQPELAQTLKRIQRDGSKGFYEGVTADFIVEEMKRGGGIITHQDLINYTATVREPVIFDYKDYKIISMGLPSSGGVLLQQMFTALEDYPIAKYGFQSKEAVQLMVEIERRAYADRALYLGDADFVHVPLASLVNKNYVKSRMSDFVPEMASKSSDIEAGDVMTIQEKEETTHFSIADEMGNVVSLTTTINGAYGSRVVVGGAGFILNNEMDDFSAKPGRPNKFGLLGAEANSIEPGKRMLSAMSPTVVLKDGKPILVVGTPGGSTIITSVFQTLVNILDFGLSPEDAVNSPKFHHQWKPDVIYVEKDFPKSLIVELEKMGYEFEERSPIGRTEVLQIHSSHIAAVADKRGDDSVAGL